MLQENNSRQHGIGHPQIIGGGIAPITKIGGGGGGATN